MDIKRERLTEKLRDEITPLLEQHYEEIAQYKDIPLNIGWADYWALQERNELVIVTVRDEEVLVGYCVFFLAYHSHYKGHRYAWQDVIYLDPAKRGGTTAIRLLREAEKVLKYEDVAVIMQHMKVKHDFGRLMEFAGYELSEKIYTKRL